MFDRLSDAFKRVMPSANQEASRMQSRGIHSGHLLLGLANDAADPASAILLGHGASVERLRGQTDRLLVSNPALVQEYDTKEIVAAAISKAQDLNHWQIETHHLLLGLIQNRSCLAAQVLQGIGVDLNALELQVLDQIPPGSGKEIARRKSLEQRFGSHPEVLQLKQRIEVLQSRKEAAVKSRQFQEAASLRDQQQALHAQLQQLYAELERKADS